MKPYLVNNATDEYYTPDYAIKPLLEYIPKGVTIWCPFDLPQSGYLSVFREHGCKVVASHIDKGKDFFAYEPKEKIDFIISNPPFSKKTEVLERLCKLGKPFAMLLPINSIFCSQARFQMLADNQCEFMIFDKRIEFFTCYKNRMPIGSPPFLCGYVGKSIFGKPIVYKRIQKHSG